MNSCINTNSAEFRALKEGSGLSDFKLKVAIDAYQTEHPDRWPHLDEISGANSTDNLKQKLEVNKDNVTSIQKILTTTNTQSVEEATIQINNQHRDLNTSILPLHNDAIITIEQRPSPFRLEKGELRDFSNISSPIFIGQSLETLGKQFGIQTVFKTTAELKRERILEQVPEGAMASAFILDGNIIVNSDIASVDAPVHELMHVLLGSLKFTQPDLYFNIIQTAQELPTFSERAALYPHRGQSDVLEEVFVQEYAKYLTGINNAYSNLDPEIKYQLDYEMSRTLDTILNGDNSVRSIPTAYRFATTLRNLGMIVNSKNMESKFQEYKDSAYMHRVFANIKSDLLKSKKLEEIC